MKDLRQHIQENRDLFDDELPEKGHWERFENRLDIFNKKNTKKKQNGFLRKISIAASFILLLGLGSLYFYKNQVSSEILARQEISDPFVVTNEFFQEQMNDQIVEIECKLTNVDQKIREQVIADLKDVMQENTVFVENIRKDMDTELAMMYLVRHYRSNIEALQLINTKLGFFVEC